MEKKEFFENLRKQASKLNINMENDELEKFFSYMNLLIDWNEKINLTAITEPEDIIKKHFVDSLEINKYIMEKSNVIDVGTGAGFPGLPLKIVRKDINITLLDSLNKRINFLNEVISFTDLNNIKTVHFRAEDAGKNTQFREKFDVVTSRAVAPLNILAEYMLPFAKVNGCCICMKGSNIDEEVKTSVKAINELGGKIENLEEFELPDSDIKRSIVIIRKIKSTPSKYPRKAGMPSKNPII